MRLPTIIGHEEGALIIFGKSSVAPRGLIQPLGDDVFCGSRGHYCINGVAIAVNPSQLQGFVGA